MGIKNYQSLNTSVQTIQPEVDMMERGASEKSEVAKKGQKEVRREHWRLDRGPPGREE